MQVRAPICPYAHIPALLARYVLYLARAARLELCLRVMRSYSLAGTYLRRSRAL